MMITKDSFTLLLLCSQLGLEKESLKPMSAKAWYQLAGKLQAMSLSPENLLEGNIDDLQADLSLTAEETSQIDMLISRSEDLARHLEKLEHIGILPMTCIDADYPNKYRQRLKDTAPTVLFYAGEKELLGQPGIAVVGSRHLDEAGVACAEFVGNACGISGQVLYSGGAKGVDTISMDAALEARGTAVGVLAHSLEKAVRPRKDSISQGNLCLVSSYSPSAGFSVGAAMGRNRLIYCLSDFAIVVASDVRSGGTWAGATEAIKKGWVPVFVLEHEDMPEGNKALIQNGGIPFPQPFPQSPLKLPAWLREKSSNHPGASVQMDLF
jgi:predicted Rossmann fold nucleotide-binding protein DprA/Smf involved in DNA uptake